MQLKIFVFTYDRYETTTTPLALESEGLDYVVLCHTERQKRLFVEGGRVKPERLIATCAPKGLANNRNAALDMMDDGEWALFLVDDLIRVTILEDYDNYAAVGTLDVNNQNQNVWKRKLDYPISLTELVLRAPSLVREADRVGASLVGFASNANPMYRKKHFSYRGLADGRAWIVRKTDLRFDVNAQLMDDYCFTARNLQRFGAVVVDNWILFDCERYSAGGYGSQQDRLEQKKSEAAYLVSTYPRHIRYADKKGCPPKSHVRIVG